MISNGGYFTLSEKNSKDNTTLLISYLGYVNQEIAVSSLKRFYHCTYPSIFELNDVAVLIKA
jgi:hypothetical protein